MPAPSPTPPGFTEFLTATFDEPPESNYVFQYDLEQSVEEFVLATEGISYPMPRNVRLVLSTGDVMEIPINLNVLDVPVTEYNPEPGQ